MKEKEFRENAIEEARVAIQVLKGKEVRRINRICDMFCISFGEMIEDNGSIFARYAFHLQCTFRIVKDKKILLTSRDMYLPASKFYGEKFQWKEFYKNFDEFQWDTKGNSAFDENLLNLENEGILNDIIVIDTDVTSKGDLIIKFNNGMILETYLTTTAIEESWRFMDSKPNTHYVIFEDE